MTGRERLIQTKRETTHIQGAGEETRGKKQRERMKGRETGTNCMQQGKKTSLLKTASTVSQSFFLLSFFLFFMFVVDKGMLPRKIKAHLPERARKGDF